MSSKLCAVIDYGMGNLHSAHGALQTVAPDTRVLVTSDPETILKADHVVLPGVGAIRDCMAEIRRQGIDQVVAEVRKTKPLLGICVGPAGDDGPQRRKRRRCLPWPVSRSGAFFGNDLYEDGEHLKVPHMGWNKVQQGGAPAVGWHSPTTAVFILCTPIMYRQKSLSR